jgi:pimeloyl-ACP methyl ester carboxylesterase
MSVTPRLNRFLSLGPHGFHRLSYVEWGEADNPHVVICAHGLTRNARDFDELARALARDCRVICPDIVGRGGSDWLDHKEDYGFSLYVSDAAALIARIAPAPVAPRRRLFSAPRRPQRPAIDWVGTSMGGLIGMMLAAKARSPIRRLVLNDIGAMVPWAGLIHLQGSHSKTHQRFDDLAAIEGYLRHACASFGPLDDAQWAALASHSARRRQDGGYELDFDPGIVESLRRGGHEDVRFGMDFLFGVDLWSVWDKVKSPTLVLRGEDSPLLSESTAQRMLSRGPKTTLVEFPAIGHAPWLKTDEQIAPICEFLTIDRSRST